MPSRRTLAAALAVLVALSSMAVPATAAAAAGAPKTLPGIDVSHWQGAINWSAVAKARIRFVIAKATEGRTWNDPRYARNRTGATDAGIRFGAYHFALPDSSANDAIAEADHFVNVARLRRGNLVPVLDLERTGGLSRAALISWTKTWLARVTARTGVKPIIYVSPSFWRTYLGNTTWFASAGYRLWIAHYGVSSPSVPASNWAGRGWTMWQYTSCGSVRGISGCVDRDRFNGASLSAITI